MKLREARGNDGTLHGYSFMCPACNYHHVYYTSGRLVWQFNGNVDAPTFTPSLLNTWTNTDEGLKDICHLFVTNGVIQYCSDCTHDMAGKSIEMVDVD